MSAPAAATPTSTLNNTSTSTSIRASTSSTRRPLPPTTTTSAPTPAFLDRFISTIASAFHSTALTTTFICEIDSIPPQPPYPLTTTTTNTTTTTIAAAAAAGPSQISHARCFDHFAIEIHKSMSHPPAHAEQNAILTEAGDWAAVASWEPPSYSGPPFSRAKSNPGPVLSEWRAVVAQMRAQYVGYAEEGAPGLGPEKGAPQEEERKLEPHYHLSFLARVPGREDVEGAVSAVMLPFLARARQEGVPVWLEATSPHAVAVYQHYGFRICEEVTIGVGRVGADGWPRESGPGVTAWGMLWDGKSVGC